jgi:hypothetical protein
MTQSNAAAKIRRQFRLAFCAGLLPVSIKTSLSLKQYHRCSSSSSNIGWPHLSHLGIGKSNLSFMLVGDKSDAGGCPEEVLTGRKLLTDADSDCC